MELTCSVRLRQLTWYDATTTAGAVKARQLLKPSKARISCGQDGQRDGSVAHDVRPRSVRRRPSGRSSRRRTWPVDNAKRCRRLSGPDMSPAAARDHSQASRCSHSVEHDALRAGRPQPATPVGSPGVFGMRGITRGTEPGYLWGISRAVGAAAWTKTLVESGCDGVGPTRNEKVGSRIVGYRGRPRHKCDRQQMRDTCSPIDSWMAGSVATLGASANARTCR